MGNISCFYNIKLDLKLFLIYYQNYFKFILIDNLLDL